MNNKYQSIPTHEEFMAYVEQQGWNDWADELWDELERTKWLTNKGVACSNWHIIANARNGVIMNRLGVINKKKHKSEDIVINQIGEEFPSSERHYTCYTDGYCNEFEEAHNGGAAGTRTQGDEGGIQQQAERLNWQSIKPNSGSTSRTTGMWKRKWLNPASLARGWLFSLKTTHILNTCKLV